MIPSLSSLTKVYSLTLLIFFGSLSVAAERLSMLEYYGVRSEAQLDALAQNPDFRRLLGNAIKQGHFRTSYKNVREFIFGELDLKTDNQGYYVECVYCEVRYHNGEAGRVGPGRIPNNSVMNVEHTWPQSRFGGRDKGFQKIDAHHLFPSNSRANSIRGNDEFGEVDNPTHTPCGGAKKGHSVSGGGSPVFEPPESHKGNVARALFYFAVRYDLRISAREEAFLREWHEEDPVDEEERLRNELIYEYQGNRNPFVDHPEWANAIADF